MLKKFFNQLFCLDLRSLALMRIMLGAAILIDLVDRGLNLSVHYTNEGVLPISALGRDYIGRFSFHMLNGSYWYQLALFMLAGFFAFRLIVGYKTKFSTIISWIFLVSLQNRNLAVLYGADAFLLLGVMWSMFLPLGARFSIDAYLNKKKPSNRNTALSMGTFTYIMLIAILFALSGYLKEGSKWIEGTMLFLVFQIPDLRTPLGAYLLHNPLFLRLSSWYTVIVERIVPFLIIYPIYTAQARIAALILLVFFHTSIAVFMGLYMFSFVSLSLLAALIPSIVWNWVFLRKIASKIESIRFLQKLIKKTERYVKKAGNPSDNMHLSVIQTALVIFIFSGVAFWSFRSYQTKVRPYGLHPVVQLAYRAIRLDQFNGYFTTGPTSGIYSPELVGKTDEKKEVLLHSRYFPLKSNTDLIGMNYDVHWKRYLQLLYILNNNFVDINTDRYHSEDLSPWFLQYVCRTWDKAHVPRQSLKSVKLTLYFQPISIDLKKHKEVRQFEYEYECGALFSSNPPTSTLQL